MIEVRGLSKRYGPALAVDELTFHVAAGRVTGFLGPNGAGKSTTMRLILGAVAAAAGIASSFGAFMLGQAILSGKDLETHAGDPRVARSVIGAGLYLAVLSLLALGLGAMIRHTAGAIVTLIGLVLVLPVLVQGLPPAWQTTIAKYLPSAAGQAIIGRTKFTPPGHLLSPWTGVALFCAYAAAALAAAAVVLNRRDT